MSASKEDQTPNPLEKEGVGIRCLVIQLGSLEDILQSLMALRAAKQLYPNFSVNILVRSEFSDPIKRVNWIDEIFLLPVDEIVSPILREEIDETKTLGKVARWISPLVKKPWDLLVNWSYSEASSYLSTVIPSIAKLGFERDKQSLIRCADDWSCFVQAVIQGKLPQNIHVTDILTTQLLTSLQAKVGDPIDAGNLPVTSKDFFDLEEGSSDLFGGEKSLRRWVAIQLDSTTEDTKFWAALVRNILERHSQFSIVILGNESARLQVRRLLEDLMADESLKSRILSLVGMVDFDHWASVLGRCEWLISRSSASLHLGSVLGTRVLNLCDSSISLNQSGPYGNGHYAVCPIDSDVPLSARSVYEVWAFGLDSHRFNAKKRFELHIEESGSTQSSLGCSVFRSRIRPPEDGGGVVYENLTSGAVNLETWGAMVIGQVARSWYCGWVPPIGHELKREQINSSLVRSLRQLDESLSVVCKIFEEALKTSSEIEGLSLGLASDKIMTVQQRESLQSRSKKISELEGLMDRVAMNQPFIQGFSRLSRVMMHNIGEGEVTAVARASVKTYGRLIEGVSLAKKWTSYTLDLAKPRAVSNAKVLSMGGPDL